jgi:rSAM/selenodomain-associated transferase 2
MLERISIIIPVLNEAANVQKAIDSALFSNNTEIIVVDGGSTDETSQVAQATGVMVISSPAGRAQQMNLGAKVATGDILVFLHADSLLPSGFDELIRSVLNGSEQPGKPVIAGAFTLQIDAPQPQLRWVEWGVNIRSRFCQMPYGDQAIFLRTAMFRSIGGFNELPIMEDFELIQRLKKQGEIVIIKNPVLTSARRWLQKGILQTTMINQLMILGYLIGVSPKRLRQLYRQRKP